MEVIQMILKDLIKEYKLRIGESNKIEKETEKIKEKIINDLSNEMDFIDIELRYREVNELVLIIYSYGYSSNDLKNIIMYMKNNGFALDEIASVSIDNKQRYCCAFYFVETEQKGDSNDKNSN